jgi:uncharacterized protein (DUF2062 family)
VPRKFFRKYLPDPDEILAKPWCAPFRPWLGHPNLWHLNRRSVPGAVAIGLFCGLIPGPFQMLGALICAIPLRKNIPVALAVTLYTNPLTIVPLYMIAYGYGKLLLGSSQPDAHLVPLEWSWSVPALWHWMMSLGKPLGIGVLALALTLAVLGYFVTGLAWRLYVVTAWRRRAARRRSGEGRARP